MSNINIIPFIGTTMALISVIKFVNLTFIFCGSFNECSIVIHQGKLSEKLSNKNTIRLIITWASISSILLVNIIIIVLGMNDVYYGFGGRIASSSGNTFFMKMSKSDFKCKTLNRFRYRSDITSISYF